MNLEHFKLIILAAILVVTSCNTLEPNDVSYAGGNVRVTLSSIDESTRAVWTDAQGSGNFSFEWEAVDIDSDEVENLKFVLSDGQNQILSWNSTLSTPKQESLPYSGLSVTPSEDNAHIATFQTTRYYSQEDLHMARYCFALSGSSELVDTDDRTGFHIQLPHQFTQTNDQDPTFLRDYMYMYAESEFSGDGTLLKFNHIPATLRFIITNSGCSDVFLQEVSCSVSDASSSEISAVSSAYADVHFDSQTGCSNIAFDQIGLNKITTVLEDNQAILSPGKKYTAYSVVLPLKNADAFKGKDINIYSSPKTSYELAVEISNVLK